MFFSFLIIDWLIRNYSDSKCFIYSILHLPPRVFDHFQYPGCGQFMFIADVSASVKSLKTIFYSQNDSDWVIMITC